MNLIFCDRHLLRFRISVIRKYSDAIRTFGSIFIFFWRSEIDLVLHKLDGRIEQTTSKMKENIGMHASSEKPPNA